MIVSIGIPNAKFIASNEKNVPIKLIPDSTISLPPVPIVLSKNPPPPFLFLFLFLSLLYGTKLI